MTKTNNFRILLLMLVSIVLSIMPTLYADGKVIMLHPHERITNPKDTIGAYSGGIPFTYPDIPENMEIGLTDSDYLCCGNEGS